MAMRTANVKRQTKETDIDLVLDIDGTGKSNINTGIGFFNHMLEGFSKHGFFDLTLKCDGDLDVDCHHTIEDCGIVLGNAIKEAIGDKKGIKRFGSFILPMDETLVLCAIDLSGRPYLQFDAQFSAERVGTMDTQMVKEFFYAVSYAAGMNLHIKVITPGNDHHMIEAMFKAFAKALDEATRRDPESDCRPDNTACGPDCGWSRSGPGDFSRGDPDIRSDGDGAVFRERSEPWSSADQKPFPRSDFPARPAGPRPHAEGTVRRSGKPHQTPDRPELRTPSPERNDLLPDRQAGPFRHAVLPESGKTKRRKRPMTMFVLFIYIKASTRGEAVWALRPDECLIVVGGKQAVSLGGVGHLYLDHPALPIGVVVDQFRMVFQGLVAFQDVGFHGQVEVRNGLDGFHRAKGFPGCQVFAHGFHFHEYDFAQFALRVIGDANICAVAFDAQPFMLVGVLQVCWYVHVLVVLRIYNG